MLTPGNWAREVILPPYHADWWLITLDLIPIVDKIKVFQVDYDRRDDQRNQDTYHSVIWERLQYACDQGIVEIIQTHPDLEDTDEKARNLLDKVTADPECLQMLADDLIYAYEEWLAYNRTKLTLLDPVEDQDYMGHICNNYSASHRDLEALRSEGREALVRVKSIVDATAFNEFRKVLRLKACLGQGTGLPLETQKEYEPFLKYLGMEERATGEELAPFKHYRDAYNLVDMLRHRQHVPFPVPRARWRIRFRTQLKDFAKAAKDLRGIYSEYRSALSNYIEVSKSVAVEVSSSVPSSAVAGLLEARDEYEGSVRRIEQRAQGIGKYATILSFAGAAVPPPFSIVAAAPLMLAGLASRELSIILESLTAYSRGYTAKGLSNYFGFLDSIARSSRPDEVQYRFWREE